MYALVRGGFILDVAAVLLVTIILGSFVAAGIASAADDFFVHTVSDVVGEYGEYDLIVHVRTESRREALRALRATLRAKLPGARVKESATVLSVSNFLVSLPKKDEESVTALVQGVSGIPGFAGYTFLLEPKVTVSGVGSKTAPIVQDKLTRLDGVEFALRDGGDIHLICESPESVKSVAQAAEAILGRYQVVDIRFAPGALASEGAFRGRLVQRVAAGLAGGDVKGQVVRDVTPRGQADEAQVLAGAMVKMKAFLEAWAPQASIRLDEGKVNPVHTGADTGFSGLDTGDSVVLSVEDKPVGSLPAPEDMVVSVTDVDGDKARGIIVDGAKEPKDQSSQVLSAYLLEDGVVSGRVGSATTSRPQEDLSRSLSEAEEALAQYDAGIADAMRAAKIGEEALESYERAIDSLIYLQRALESIGVDGEADIMPIDDEAVSALLHLTEEALEAIEALRSTADVVVMFSGSYDSLLADLELWQARLESFAQKLETIQSAATGAGQVAEMLRDMSSAASGILSTLHQLDPASLHENIEAAKVKLAQMSEVDVDGIAEQVREVKSALPKFDGDEIVSSIGAINKLVGDQQGSSDKVQLLIESGLTPDELATAVEEVAGKDVLAVYTIPVGIVQPGVRSEVQNLLRSVKSTISGLAACGIVAVSLMVDHSTVIAGAIGLERRRQGVLRPGFEEYLYGALAGAISLYAIGAITGSTLGSAGGPLFAAIGGLLGLVGAGVSLKMSPVDLDEVEASIAFGMTGTQIMREIIIPSGKPGILSFINRPHVVFDGIDHVSADRKDRREGGSTRCSQCAM